LDVDVDLLVRERGSLGSAILLEGDEPVVLKFIQVREHVLRPAVDRARERPDALGLVLGDGIKEFEIRLTEDAPEGSETLDTQNGVGFALDVRAAIERLKHVARTLSLVVDALAALRRFRVELGHLEGPLQLCTRCSPGRLATYWTRNLTEHLVTE
jgi:hypothetical protein